jgi:hypothetical protein
MAMPHAIAKSNNKDTIVTRESQLHYTFDAADLDYMVLHLTIEQLRHEHYHATIQVAVCRQFGDPDEYYWEAYLDAVKLALEVRRWLDTPLKTKSKPGPARNHLSIAEIKACTDILTVVSQYVQLRKCGTRYIGKCPFHDDRAPSLVVYPDTQTWYCFGCNQGGDVISFAMKINNLDFSEAIKILAGR